MSKRKSRSEKKEIPPVLSEIYDFKSTLEHFSLSDLASATNNFSPGIFLENSAAPSTLTAFNTLVSREMMQELLGQFRHDF